jgi:hypothetical protein
MTTVTAKLNTALITMASRGDRPRCADPIDHQLWTSEDQHDRDIAAAWCAGGHSRRANLSAQDASSAPKGRTSALRKR